MSYEEFHLSDEQLLLNVEGEMPAQDQRSVRGHLEACWSCRARLQELENAIADVVRVHQRISNQTMPLGDGPRALLKARLNQLSETTRGPRFPLRFRFAFLGAIAAALALAALLIGPGMKHPQVAVFSMPDSALTPGATVLIDQRTLCGQADSNNKPVPAAVQKKVFEEYRIGGADPRAYEVDYLVTPALGGADDIRNLWPHSYSTTVWNAQVKDALENQLRGMVCRGNLDLEEAQREIATDWIAAYKKYFHTDEPLAEHLRPR
jgi:hypothetical protein